ncbi:MAG: YihY family inner membrane protein [Burkholderiaceae bacterium]|nr:YihY family inner membrane protein [Burkholderiaceae bacterium]
MNSPNPSSTRWSDLYDLYRFGRRRLKEERLPQVAGGLTFTTVLALVPMLTIAFAIFTHFPMFETFRTSLEAYFIHNLIPATISNTILGYLSVFADKASRLSLVGAVALLVTTMTTMALVERTFNHVWRVKTKRPLMQRLMVYWTTITVGPLLVGASITLTSHLARVTEGVITSVPTFPLLSGVFYTLVSIALTTIAFTSAYMVIPNRFVDRRDAAWGGLVAAVAFEIAKRLFAVFIARFPTYTVIYGALAAIPIFLVWVYTCWLIILVCAVIVAALPVVKYERWWHRPTPGSAFVDAMAVLKVLADVRAGGASAAADAAMIREQTRLGFDESERLLQTMLDAGWVGRIKVDTAGRTQWGKRLTEGLDCWALLANPQQLRVADVYRLFVFNAAGNPALARQVEDAIEQGLNETLTAHFARQA